MAASSKPKNRFSSAMALSILLILLLCAAIVIYFIPLESFPVNGTFRYTISVKGTWMSSLAQRTTLELQYGSSYEIVEPQLARVNSPLLRVGSGNPQSASNALVVGSSYGNFSETIFAANFSGPNLPYPQFSYAERSIDIDIKKLIANMNATDGEITIFWYSIIGDLEATVSSNDQDPQGATIVNEGVSFPSILLTIKSGDPAMLGYGNSTVVSNLTNFADYVSLSTEKRSITSAMNLYNPAVLLAKEAVPWILVAAIAIIASKALLRRPKLNNMSTA